MGSHRAPSRYGRFAPSILVGAVCVLAVSGGLFLGVLRDPPPDPPAAAASPVLSEGTPAAEPSPGGDRAALSTASGATYAPVTMLAAFGYLSVRTGLTLDAGLAIIGDAAHGNEGYHVGRDRLNKGLGQGDYSVGESARDANPSNAAMALDIWMWDRLREFSLWLVAQCAANAPDTLDIREVIYSPDGKVVRRWDRQGVRNSGDASHLWHTHISYFRDSEYRDKVGLFRRFFAES